MSLNSQSGLLFVCRDFSFYDNYLLSHTPTNKANIKKCQELSTAVENKRNISPLDFHFMHFICKTYFTKFRWPGHWLTAGTALTARPCAHKCAGVKLIVSQLQSESTLASALWANVNSRFSGTVA